ncbi:MAG: YdeI/OmpD-associated family protein [Chloroflexota bacterium]
MRPRFFRSPEEFRAWLDKNGAQSQELLVGFHKTKAGKTTMTYAQALDEALAYGWIDGVRRSLDDDSYSIRFTPRKKGSIWSNVNVRHVQRLKKGGLMQPAGLAAFKNRSASKSGIYAFEPPPRELEAARGKRFRANKTAWAFWQKQAPSYRRTASYWVESAKREETREKRLATLIDDSSHGRKIAHLTWEKKAKATA